MEEHIRRLEGCLKKAVSESLRGENEAAILFSGGLDSSLLALLAMEHADITLYTAGTKNSHDLEYAEKTSALLNMDVGKIEILPEEIPDAISILGSIIQSVHPVTISFQLPLFFALAGIHEKTVLSGQGADELFGGYARYLKMDQETLKDALEKDLDILISDGIETDLRVAKHFEKNLKIPYLSREMVETAREVPVEYKVNKGVRKILLREAALRLGLPSDIANKEKKAVQYSSGIIKELRKIAKREEMAVNELIQHLIAK